MRTSRPISITLGDMQERVDALKAAGRYASTSEVLRAAVRALEREHAALDAIMREEVRRAVEDPRPSLAGEDVFAKLEQRYQQDLKASKRDA
ncbi:type II toxin-antitoxin system ParD family antitoxin [Aquabacter sp. CN5-332]|uniref:ribbon-helix-helix domain-containing protein n=1 Tax=Aquabacter sp. CN5-332 TaxID=3156608 RepID=UPI0032B4B4B5